MGSQEDGGPQHATEGGFRRWRLVRAGTDAVSPTLRRFMRAATAGGRLTAARATRGGVRLDLTAWPWRVIGLGVAIVVTVIWLFYGSPFLQLRHIDVEGSAVLTPDQVVAASEVLVGTPLAKVDTDGAAARIAAMRPVESVTVQRSWPSGLLITIVERVPVAATLNGKQFDLIDSHGVVFRSVPKLPSGVVAVKLASGQAGPGPNDLATRSALTVIGALTPQLRTELVTLVVDGPTRIRLELRKDRKVTWGDAEQSDLKAKVATALLTQKGQSIDVSAPEVVTIK